MNKLFQPIRTGWLKPINAGGRKRHHPWLKPMGKPATTLCVVKSARAGRLFRSRRRVFMRPKRHGVENHLGIAQCRRLKKKAPPSDIATQPGGEIGRSLYGA